MISKTLPALPFLLLLAACGDQTASDADQVTTVDLEGQPGDALPAPPDGAGDGVNDGYPPLMPPVLTGEVARSETGARTILLSWARAIELQEWDQAWEMMSDEDHARWSKREFAGLLTDLSEVTVAVPGGTMEGAAGSSYYTAPATITASDADGRPVAYEGEVVLRRVNDVPGASEEELSWHIERVTLDWTH